MNGKNYPEHYETVWGSMKSLAGKLPGPMLDFADLHRDALLEGVLSTKVKELISLGIAITVRCDGCIAYQIHDALRAGATHDEIVETIGVAVMMGGGPAVVYGAEALEALRQFETEGVTPVREGHQNQKQPKVTEEVVPAR
jgi:AhpD family alkylhydroperoxidase